MFNKQNISTRNHFIIVGMLLIGLFMIFSYGLGDVSAASNTIYVNGSSGNDLWDGLTPQTAKHTIKNATGTVETNGNIQIADGYYSGSGNSAINVTRNMSFIGQSQEKTIISGSNSSSIFTVSNGTIVSFINLTLTQGSGGTTRGGAIRVNADGDASKPSTWIKPTVTIENCSFTYNKASNGAAIGNYGDLTLKNCTFMNNTGSNGAALYSGSRFANYHINVNVNGCNFINNKLTGSSNGGAIFNNDNSNVFITLSYFSGNIGNNGGAINNNAVGNMTVTHCTFQNNTGSFGADIVFYGNKLNQAYNIANFNKFLSNGLFGSVHVGDDAPMDLRWNWWGTNLDPYNTKFSPYNSGKITVGLESNQGLMIYDPWVVLSVNSISSTILNTKNATITADLNHLSDGNLVSEQLSDGKITLSVPWGSFNKTTAIHSIDLDSVNGAVSATFFANEGAINPLYNPVQITTTTDGYTTNTADSAYVNVNPISDVYLIVTGNKTNPKVNESVNLTYKLGNNGLDPANNVTVTIPLPTNFQVSNITGDGSWNFDSKTNTITWMLKNLGQTETYLYVTGNFTKPGNYNFNANISTDTYNLNTQGVTPLTIQVTQAVADIYVIVTGNKTNPKVNESVNLTYKLGNNGPDPADNVTVTIPLPANFQVSNITGNGFWTFDSKTNTIIWTFANMDQSVKYLYVTGNFTKPGTYKFNANISTDTYNLNTQGVTPLTITATTTETKANIYLTVTSNKTHPKVNETVKLTYKLGNNGPDAADNVIVTIPLPVGFNVSTITGDGFWNYNIPTNTIIWTIKNLPISDPYLYLTGKFTEPGNYKFNANITADTYNLNTSGVVPLAIQTSNKPTPHNPTNNTNQTNDTAKGTGIGMYKTGLPINAFILALFMVLGGIFVSKRK
jgi:uncharacterized repeat protein (TIGR01451 family)